MSDKYFEFKQFKIRNGDAGMAVSTDGVLLGAWAAVERSQDILDLGTGTGLLALMCAQRNTSCRIRAMDIAPSAIETAQSNINSSPWPDRITVVAGDVRDNELVKQQFDDLSFDHIICNPPYFVSGQSAQEACRARARHTVDLNQQELLDALCMLLSENGAASLVMPVVEGQTFLNLAQNSGWQLTRCWQVKPTENKPVNRLLFEIRKNANNQPDELDSGVLTIREHGRYSAGFVALTQTFYLKM